MPDVFTKKKRSEVMSRIRSRGNRDTELALVKLFRRHRITGWRRQVEICGGARSPQCAVGGASVRASRLVGSLAPPKAGTHRGPGRTGKMRPTFRVRPDFIFPQLRLAVFVDGCFWHGCPKHATKPKNNAAFWRKKLAANKRRDVVVNRALRRAGWSVVRIWECALSRKNEARLWRRLQRALV